MKSSVAVLCLMLMVAVEVVIVDACLSRSSPRDEVTSHFVPPVYYHNEPFTERKTETQPTEPPTTTTTSTTQSPPAHEGYANLLGFPPQSLLKFHPVGLSWLAAKAVCESERAKMAAFDSPNKMAALIGLFFEKRYDIVADIPNGLYVDDVDKVEINNRSYGSTSSNSSLMYWCNRRRRYPGCSSMVLGFCGSDIGGLDCSENLNVMLIDCDRPQGEERCLNEKLPFVCELLGQ